MGGHLLPVPLPYAWLDALAPGFQAFRAPEQASVGAYLALAVLAALGARGLLHRVPRRGQGIAAWALVALVAVELWAPASAIALPGIPSVDRWLAGQPTLPTLLVLPLASRTPLDWQRQTEILYDSTVHWKRLVNGQASVTPSGWPREAALLAAYPAPAARLAARRLRIAAVVLRLTWLSLAQRTAALQGCATLYRDAWAVVCDARPVSGAVRAP